MSSTSHKIFTFSASMLMMAAVIFAAWLQLYWILAIPVALVAGILLIQHPEYLFYILMLAIPWSIEYNFTPAIGTDLPDEPIMLVVSAAAIILFIYHRRSIPPVFRHPLVFILLIQLVWLLVTVFTSSAFLLSLKYFLAKGWYLLAFVAAPLFLLRDEKVLKRSMLILLFSMMAFVFYAMLRHYQYNFSFEKINTALEPIYRNHVSYSAILVFMVPVLFVVYQLNKNFWFRIFLSAVIFITLVALYFSYARGAWLALIAALVAYWLIRKKLLLAGYVFFIVICVAAVLLLRSQDRYLNFAPDYQSTIYHTDFREHLVATYRMKDVSTAERFYRWVAGVNMIGDSWKTGFGPSTFYNEYKSYAQPAFKTWVSKNEERSTVHNYFLLLIIEQGVLGLVMFIILLGLMFWYVQQIYHRTSNAFWKRTMAAIGAILVMQCVVNSLSDLIETDKVGSVFYLCLSIIIIADLKTRKFSDKKIPPTGGPSHSAHLSGHSQEG